MLIGCAVDHVILTWCSVDCDDTGLVWWFWPDVIFDWHVADLICWCWSDAVLTDVMLTLCDDVNLTQCCLPRCWPHLLMLTWCKADITLTLRVDVDLTQCCCLMLTLSVDVDLVQCCLTWCWPYVLMLTLCAVAVSGSAAAAEPAELPVQGARCWKQATPGPLPRPPPPEPAAGRWEPCPHQREHCPPRRHPGPHPGRSPARAGGQGKGSVGMGENSRVAWWCCVRRYCKAATQIFTERLCKYL